MKEPREILFNHYDTDPDGGLLISDEAILAAMEEYAKERAVWFALKRDIHLSRLDIEEVYNTMRNQELKTKKL